MDNDCRKSKNVWKSACNYEYIFANAVMLYDGAVGLISIHLAFYQMNPWPTALAAFSIFGTHTSSTPVGIFCFLAFYLFLTINGKATRTFRNKKQSNWLLSVSYRALHLIAGLIAIVRHDCNSFRFWFRTSCVDSASRGGTVYRMFQNPECPQSLVPHQDTCVRNT
jgi:hypothetical protein